MKSRHRKHQWQEAGISYWDSHAAKQLLNIRTTDTINKHRRSLELDEPKFTEEQLWLLYLINVWVRLGFQPGANTRYFSRKTFIDLWQGQNYGEITKFVDLDAEHQKFQELLYGRKNNCAIAGRLRQ